VSTPPRRIAVIGGGWAGIAAAVEATARGHRVTLIEMAAQLGGRARSIEDGPSSLDNGQHILIGAYRETLTLMRKVGIDPHRALTRLPLMLVDAQGNGLRLPSGVPALAFARAVMAASHWPLGARVRLLSRAAGWLARGFTCAPQLSVAQLTARLPSSVRRELIEPLCVAALNTPAEEASASVFLRVLRDGLFGGPGSADLLLPRTGLSSLLPGPAGQWLEARGVKLMLGTRVTRLVPREGAWTVDEDRYDAVVLATTALEAARLVEPIAPDWAEPARGLRHEPIATVYLHSPGTLLPQPMVALHGEGPGQFIFDHGALGLAPGRFALVASGAGPWVERGLAHIGEAALNQACRAFEPSTWKVPPRVLLTLADKRATFACTPALNRPVSAIARGLVAAGDYVAGPYPATLEGAVRSGIAAARAVA
jgi:squalene-associated FAD-dependent desaturase